MARMKLGRLLLTLVLLFAPLAAEADGPKFCQGKNFATCFQILLQGRCATYSNWNLLSKREYFCEQSVVDMIEIFRPFQPKDDPHHVVAFPKQIGELITDPKAFAYLRDIPAAIEKSIRSDQLFNLWEFTLERTSKNEDLALKWIAVLFQDNHPDENIVLAQARVGFGNRKKERKLTPKELKVWEEAIGALSFDRLDDKSGDSDSVFLRVYPDVDNTHFTSGMYHFYFSAHIARTLQKSRKSKTVAGIDMNGFAPFLLNAMYEMQADQDPDKSPLKDAKPFSATEMNHSLRDTYSGYVGALFGLGGTALAMKAESFDSFSKRFAANPSETIRSLYKSFRPKK